MKQSLILLALLAAFSAQAQTSNSNSNSSANSSPTISSGNTASESSSASVSNPNNQANQQIQLNTYNPDRVQYDNTSTSTSNSTQRVINEGVATTNQNVHYSGTQTVKNVPGIAMSGPASGPCTGASGGLGVAGPGFGVGLNGSKVDDGCTVRENTRVLGQLFQALDSADPMKAQAREALVRSMAILDNMNSKIAGDYAPPAQPKKVAEAPAPVAAPAPVVQTAAPAAQPAPAAKPVAVATAKPGVTLVAPPAKEPTDPYIRARLGLPKL